tara:strand:+ start:3441 stop:5558 length:2118 start_codon:yes stop_codon:yes gene_type:complete
MSLNIETTSDKPNFINYFSDPLTLPQNSQVVMTKTNVAIPVVVAPIVEVPNIPIVERGTSAIEVGIDGIVKQITWAELYDAANAFFTGHQSLDRLNAPARFFDDNYYFYPNQQLVLRCENEGGGGTTEKMKIPFNNILARAIDGKFQFYRVDPSPTYVKVEDNELTNTDDVNINTPLVDATGAKIKGKFVQYNNDKMTELGFNVAYTPQNISIRTENYINWDAGQSLINWVKDAVDSHKITSGAGGVNVAFANAENTAGGDFTIDPNGGWLTTLPTHTGGTMAWGLNMTGSGERGRFDPNFLAGAGTICDDYLSLIDIGFKITENAGGNKVIQIINNSTKNAAYDGAGIGQIPQPILEPSFGVEEIINNGADHFFIHMKRGAIVNGTSEFIISLFGGGATAVPDDDDKLMKVASITFGGGRLQPTLVMLSDNVAGNIFNQTSFIEITAESKEQGNYYGNNFLNKQQTGGTFNREMYLKPLYEGFSTAIFDEILDFWRAWGLVSNEQLCIPDTIQEVYFINKSVGTDLMRTWKIPVNLKNSSKLVQYIVGQSDITKIWDAGGTGEMILNQGSAIANLPSQLHIALDNVDLKNFNGTLLGGVASQLGFSTGQRPSVDRTIGTVPLPVDTMTESGSYLIQYEPLNLIYRNINNPTNFTLNQLQVAIFYYDFNTNIRMALEAIDGICNLELNIKQGYSPKKPENDLLPY